jgi:prepilin-type N-terminal cleavage/methylation domain-containing protein
MKINRYGFTLAEMLLVLVILGILMGIGMGGADRMDPGARGLQRMLQSFVQSSRDRARATGQEVILQYEPGSAEIPGKFARLVYRKMLEATFEPAFAEREALQLTAPALLEKPGRFGAGLDLSQGGGVTITGRGGNFHSPQGLQLEFDFKINEMEACQLAKWEDLLELKLRRDGSIQWIVAMGEPGKWVDLNLISPVGTVSAGRWHHLRAVAASGRMQLILDGKLVAEEVAAGAQPPADGSLFMGDSEGRFLGMIDEVQVWGQASEAGPEFTSDHDLFLSSTEIVLDRHGRLDPNIHSTSVIVRLAYLGEEVNAFNIGAFTEEPLP